MQKRIAVLLAFVLFFLSGCHPMGAEKRENADSEKAAEIDTFLEEAVYDFSYERPNRSPNILLNRNGYDTTDSKVAFFKGEELPEEFQIVDKETKKVILCGKIEKIVYNEDCGEYLGRGDFSQVEKIGTYYLQAKYIGQSYSFDITQKRLETIYDNLINSFYYHRCGCNLVGEIPVNNHRACHKGKTRLEGTETELDTVGGWHTDSNFNKDVIQSTKIISDLMLAYEFLYDGGKDGKESLGEEMESLLEEVFYEGQFLLKLQDHKTGAFYGGVKSKQKLTVAVPEDDEREFYVEEISEQATAECVGVFAQFGRIFENREPEMAAQCLEAAIRGYSYLEKQQYEGETRYYAACELYKTTGYKKYHTYIMQYLQKQAQETEKGKRKLYGDLAYLTTIHKVDMDVCSSLMNDLMSQAQEISACAKKDGYLVYAPEGIRNSQTILEGAFLLAIIDHVVTSHEYIGVMENQVDYLFGRNETGENLVTNKGVLKSVNEEDEYDLYLQSTLVFILYELIEREAK